MSELQEQQRYAEQLARQERQAPPHPPQEQEPPAVPERQKQQQGASTDDQSPPWGEDFDPEKAWKLIQNLRQENRARNLTDEDRQKLEEYNRLMEASKTDLERKTEEAARWQSEAQRWRATSVSSTIQALAAADFVDPADAANALDPAKYLDAGGAIDNEAIKKDLADLLERKPHFRRASDAPSGPRVPAPNRAQGAGGTPPAANPAAEFASLIQGQLRSR